jgi:hypothetical protein
VSGSEEEVAEKDRERARDVLGHVKRCTCGDCTSVAALIRDVRAETELEGVREREWDVRVYLVALKASGLDSFSHEDGWTLMTTATAEGLREAKIAAERLLAGVLTRANARGGDMREWMERALAAEAEAQRLKGDHTT